MKIGDKTMQLLEEVSQSIEELEAVEQEKADRKCFWCGKHSIEWVHEVCWVEFSSYMLY
jgi:hypothetical protein